MLESNLLRIRVAAGGFLAVVFGLGILACAGSGSMPESSMASPGEVADVWVDQTAEGSVVTVVGPQLAGLHRLPGRGAGRGGPVRGRPG